MWIWPTSRNESPKRRGRLRWPGPLVRFSRNFEEHASEPEMPEDDDLPGKLLWEIKNHLQTHPPPAERLRALEAIGG